MTTKKVELIEGDDHLLTKILLLLPPKSIFRFLSVSKRWNALIKDPFFLRRYPTPRRRDSPALLAFFQKNHYSFSFGTKTDPRPMNILPTSPNNNIIKFAPQKLGYFVNSTNGLVLCHSPPHKFTVFNPVTKTRVALPPPPRSGPVKARFPTSIGLMCLDNVTQLVPDYIVVQTYVTTTSHPPHDEFLHIETYSSKSGAWASSKLTATGYFVLQEEELVVANGFFHWYAVLDNGSRCIAVYNPNDLQNSLQLIAQPQWSTFSSTCVVTRSPCDDSLWCAASDEFGMRFWMLPPTMKATTTTIPGEEWVLMYDIGVECLSLSIGSYGLGGFCLEGVVSWDPLVVLVKKKESWFLYDLDTMTGKPVTFNGHLIHHGSYMPHLCPFFESPFLSSYAL